MKRSFFYIFAVLLSLSLVISVQGQENDNWSEEEAVEANVFDAPDVSRPKMFSAVKCIGKTKNGYMSKRYLMIEYPWSKIQNASLEVRIIGPEAENQMQFCKPVYFMSKFAATLKRIQVDINRKKSNNPHYRNDIEYPISLFHEYGLPEPENLELLTVKPIAGARADYFHMVFKNPETNELETTLVFHDLDQWAVDSERLAIELRGKAITDAEGKQIKEIEFEKPCKIKIWLLRDDYVVWEETFQWPGVEKGDSRKSGGKKVARQYNDDDDEDPRQAAKKMEKADKTQNNDDQADEGDEAADFDSFGDDF